MKEARAKNTSKESTGGWFFPFKPGRAALPQKAEEVLGRKGANLARMCSLGFPVPPGFTIGTPVCRAYLENGTLPSDFEEGLRSGIAELEAATGKRFGATRRPLLVSVRSGAAVSMPGMLDTVLNIGLTEFSVEGLMRLSGNPRFALDSFRRLIAMYGDVVRGIPREAFEEVLREAKEKAGVIEDYELDAKALQAVVRRSLRVFEENTGGPFPQDPYQQLREAVEGVFRSWQGERAVRYRKLHDLHGLAGTAATVQAMVFGNSGGSSGTGVAFTRNPATGRKELYVDFLYNAQGEDLVAGIRTPESGEELKQELPLIYKQLERIARTLEENFRDMQDIEFTIEEGALFLLQSRTGKRSPRAALRIACDMVKEGLITRREALDRLRDLKPEQLIEERLCTGPENAPAATAIPASGGVATGKVALSSETAVALSKDGDPVILVREETSAADIAGMAVAAGILTARGGRTSHAAVVARHRGLTCLVGCTNLRIDSAGKKIFLGGRAVKEGDWISLDGGSGAVYTGRIAVERTADPPELLTVRQWIKTEGMKDHPLAL